MNEDGQKTPPQSPDATGKQDLAATTPKGGAGATNDDDTVTLKKEDYKNLISARDRANNVSTDANERLAAAEDFMYSLAKEREIDSFLADNKEKFSLVTRDDLMAANSPEDLEKLASQMQRRFEDVVQAKLLDVQKFNEPQLTPEQVDKELDELKKNPGKGAFARMVSLKMSRKA